MNIIKLFLIILFLNKISSLSRGLYLSKEKCFYDNYYDQMNIVLTYKILDTDIKKQGGPSMRWGGIALFPVCSSPFAAGEGAVFSFR